MSKTDGASRRRWPVRAHLVVLAVVVSLVFVAVVGLLSARTFSNAEAKAKTEARFQAGLAAKDIADSVSTTLTRAASVAPQLAPVFSAPEGCALSFTGVGSLASGHLDVIDGDGRVLCSSQTPLPPRSAVPYRSQGWLGELSTAPAPLVRGPVTDPRTGKPSLALVVPIARSPQPPGAMAVMLDLDGIGAGLVSVYGSPKHYQFVVTDPAAGVVLSSSNSGLGPGSRLAGTAFAAGGAGHGRGLGGSPRLYGSGTVKDLGWAVFAGVTRTDALAPARAELRRDGILGVASLGALVAMALLVHRRLLHPLRRLTFAVRHPEARAEVGGPREIAVLAEEYNALRDRQDASRLRLQQLNADIEAVLAKLARAQEEERRSVSLALHDNTIQSLTVALWNLDYVDVEDSDTQRQLELITKTRDSLQAALDAARRLLVDLHPPALDQLGLGAAVGDCLARLGGEASVSVELDDRLAGARLSSHLESLAFRTIQEALNNIRRHAFASRVNVRLAIEDERFTATVADDGVGFDAREAEERRKEGHLGLVSMRETVHLAQGTFVVASATGGGTEVNFTLPLSTGIVSR